MNSRIRIAAVLFFLAMVLGALGPLARRAHAYQYTSSGRPGQVTIYKVNGTLSNNRPQLYDVGTRVYRSPASTGSQTVLNYYQIYRWNGSSWAYFYSTPAKSRTIPAGTSWVTMPQLNILPSQYANYYYIVQRIQWSGANGVVVGSLAATMNQSGDYQCVNVLPSKCSVGNGYIYLAPGP